MKIRPFTTVAAALLLLMGPAAAWSQTSLPDPNALAGQNLTGYTHMFLAYAIAWVLVFGWIVSIGRRMGGVQRELEG